MIEKKDLRNFQIVYIDEKKCNIKYDGIEEKKARPYLIIKKNISQGHFLAAPLTTKIKNRNKYHNIWYFIKIKPFKPSFIKLDHLILFENSDLINISFLENIHIGIDKKIKIKEILINIFK